MLASSCTRDAGASARRIELRHVEHRGQTPRHRQQPSAPGFLRADLNRADEERAFREVHVGPLQREQFPTPAACLHRCDGKG